MGKGLFMKIEKISLIVVVAFMILVGLLLYVRNSNNYKQKLEEDISEQKMYEMEGQLSNVSRPELETREDAIIIKNPSDLDKVPDNAPQSFIAYLSEQMNTNWCDYNTYPEAKISLYPDKLSDGFVNGAVDCGNEVAVTWYYANNQWNEIGIESYLTCNQLLDLEIPSNFIDACVLEEGSSQVVPNPTPAIEL